MNIRKVLLLAPIFPYPPDDGSRLRTCQILKILSNRFYVDLITFYQQEDNLKEGLAYLRKLCRNIYYFPLPVFRKSLFNRFFVYYREPSIKKHISQIMVENNYDIIQVEKIFMACYIDFKLFKDKILVIDSWGVDSKLTWQKYKFESGFLRKIFNYIKYLIHKKQEIYWVKKFDFLISITDDHTNFYKKYLYNKNITEIPNSVDSSYFKKDYTIYEIEKNSLIFMGIMNFLPNIDAIKYFMKDIYPLIVKYVKIKLYIVGKNPADEIRKFSNDNIIVTGEVEDIKEYLFKSEIFISPIRIGSGLRNKIIQAMAASKPIVATTESCEGLNVKNEKELLIADDPLSFAKAVLRLLYDEELKRKLATNAYNYAKQNYSEEIINKKWEEFYDQILNSDNIKK
ncbi:MAG: glycosyltransferase family 4 protein [Endomicrobiia bacterium]